MDQQIHAAQLESSFLQLSGHPYGIVTPGARWAERARRQCHFDLISELIGINDKLIVSSGTGGYPAVKSNRGGQRESVIVVRVLSDQVHAAGRAINMRIHAKFGAKLFRD